MLPSLQPGKRFLLLALHIVGGFSQQVRLTLGEVLQVGQVVLAQLSLYCEQLQQFFIVR